MDARLTPPVSPMLATLVDAPFSDPGWVFEPKYDGIRAFAHVRKNKVRLFTRQGRDVTSRYPELASLGERVRGDAVLDGEIICLDSRGRPSFQQLQQRVGLRDPAEIRRKAKEFPASYAVFDLLRRGASDLRDRPLAERRGALERVVRPGGRLILSPQTAGRGEKVYRDALRQGLEGIVAKRKDSPYRGGRSDDWLKIKAAHRQEVVIGGWTDPRRTRPLIGALAVGLYGEDGKLHWVGNVGTGFARESLRQVHDLLVPLATARNPFAEPVTSGEAIHWVKPELVCEVTFAEWTRGGRLRIPRFEGLRDDKKPEECHRERERTVRAVVPAPRRAALRRRKPLEEYLGKRDFRTTREPAGKVAPPGPAARFVVQEHHASVLHYDFRLEIGGVLKSWSVPKGPSLDPGVKRLAVQVEDHPVDYLTFTGTIPEGSYGGGEVYRWDLGTFRPLDPDPLRAWERGSLRFRLDGERLRGEWRLIRTRMAGGRKPSWLLFKIRDDAARPGHVAERIGGDGGPRVKRRRENVKPAKRRSWPPGEPRFSIDEFHRLGSPAGDLTVDVEGSAVPLTSLDRFYWPKEKIRKYELLEYYIAVWPRMRPFVEGRPGILHRHPEGVEGTAFIQHDLARVPGFVTTRTLPNEAGRKIDYAVYGGLASLLYLTNMGTLEHHPWHSTVERLDRPDWLALDLDPGRGPWEEVLRLARVAREVCARRNLRAYPKTSGSRGIHLYVPLAPVHPYGDVSRVARELAEEIVRKAPRVATLERTKSLRDDRKIYVDWLQNARGKTLAAPYTARARPGATVSMPLGWDEVDGGVRIRDFTIRNAATRPAEPWAGFFEHRQHL